MEAFTGHHDPEALFRKDCILRKTQRKCCYCGVNLTVETMTVEHLVPRSKGGNGRRWNLLAACGICNGLRGSMSLDEFYKMVFDFCRSCDPKASLPEHPMRRLLDQYRRWGESFHFQMVHLRKLDPSPGPPLSYFRTFAEQRQRELSTVGRSKRVANKLQGRGMRIADIASPQAPTPSEPHARQP